jgi:hypothetical protein
VSKRIDNLRQLIEKSENCRATHLTSSVVRERLEDAKKPVWEGVVETLQLDNHPIAKRAYAWESPAAPTREKPEPEFTVVLGLPPVNSPQDAVKVAVVGAIKKMLRQSQAISDAKHASD